MKKLGRASILDILKRAKANFIVDSDGLNAVKFFYRDHIVIAFIDPIPEVSGWIVICFWVIYYSGVRSYFLDNDYDLFDAFFDH